MKKALTIGLMGAAVAATLSYVAAQLKTESPVINEAKAAEAEPEPATIVLAQNTASVLNYERGPRIIIVPQTGDRNSRASIDRNVDEDDDVAARRNVAPPVRTTPRWAPNLESKGTEPKSYVDQPRRIETGSDPRQGMRQGMRQEMPQEMRQEKRVVRHIDMSNPKAKVEIPEAPIPQPPSPRRAVLSGPPPPAEGPSPIKPTPRFGPGVRAEAPVKQDAEPEADLTNDSPPPAEVTADQPPPGYTPPAAPMRDDGYGNKY